MLNPSQIDNSSVTWPVGTEVVVACVPNVVHGVVVSVNVDEMAFKVTDANVVDVLVPGTVVTVVTDAESCDVKVVGVSVDVVDVEMVAPPAQVKVTETVGNVQSGVSRAID